MASSKISTAPQAPEYFAEQLKAAAAKIYGTPLRAFLDKWVHNWDANYARVATFITDFIAKEIPPGAAPEVGRALRRVALVAAAGDLATSMGITGWPPGEARSAAAKCFKAWIQERGGAGQADIEAGIRQVRAFLEAHGSSRFQPVVTRMDSRGAVIEEHVINRVGYWREENGERVFLVFPEAFRDQLCHGFDCRMIAKELHLRKFLLQADGSNLTRKERIPGFTKSIRVYAILGKILAADEGDDEETASA